MFLCVRWAILKAVAWIVKVPCVIPPYAVLDEAKQKGGTFSIAYQFIIQPHCNCVHCRQERGEINGEPVLDRNQP